MSTRHFHAKLIHMEELKLKSMRINALRQAYKDNDYWVILEYPNGYKTVPLQGLFIPRDSGITLEFLASPHADEYKLREWDLI